MNAAIAAIMFAGVVAYAVLAGADFGAGFWDLTAGGAERGRRPRHLVDVSLGPVWEANHTWLIYCLVVLWTGFPRAFSAITTTLFMPLGLAALGIVTRGAGFAFRKVTVTTPQQRAYGVAFALSSVVTPYCLGAVAGGIASGRVPSAGNGDSVRSWNNPTSVLGGVLAVLVCAYLAAAYLTAAAPDTSLRAYFRRRALVIAAATGAVTAAGIFVLRSDAPRLFHQLSHRGLPLLIVAALAGVAGVGLLLADTTRALRPTAALAVATVVCGWGVAQYPYLLGTHLSLSAAASPRPSLWVLVAVACAAAVLIVPSLALLLTLAGRARLASPEERPPS
ncbi:cytochrome d ubiquinol oxidase subunit II [Streptomyces sp. HPF1205]|uniref:cytochrome d ubiquinol oxidase subunit II n=1 Tax=Streptomyces sp. HPF1205 TaxID=2873262 RepID=UPI001CEC42A5|nr:cytochrome d ubiquinol oxidase subunit II [Streptomyces sp. HPF1205]